MVHGGGGGVAVELMPKLLESARTLDVSERVYLGACRHCEVHLRIYEWPVLMLVRHAWRFSAKGMRA